MSMNAAKIGLVRIAAHRILLGRSKSLPFAYFAAGSDQEAVGIVSTPDGLERAPQAMVVRGIDPVASMALLGRELACPNDQLPATRPPMGPRTARQGDGQWFLVRLRPELQRSLADMTDERMHEIAATFGCPTRPYDDISEKKTAQELFLVIAGLRRLCAAAVAQSQTVYGGTWVPDYLAQQIPRNWTSFSDQGCAAGNEPEAPARFGLVPEIGLPALVTAVFFLAVGLVALGFFVYGALTMPVAVDAWASLVGSSLLLICSCPFMIAVRRRRWRRYGATFALCRGGPVMRYPSRAETVPIVRSCVRSVRAVRFDFEGLETKSGPSASAQLQFLGSGAEIVAVWSDVPPGLVRPVTKWLTGLGYEVSEGGS